MKPAFLCFFFLVSSVIAFSQTGFKTENIFIITVDGFRWQEIFNGADSSMLFNKRFVQDTTLAAQLYWDNDPLARRRMLMPFFWNVIAKQGQLYGNRLYGNKVNVANLYKISYPGYNEIFTGYTDPRIILNVPRNNKNLNILEYLNDEPGYKGKVVAFSSWNIFPYILNEQRSGLPINSGYEPMEDDSTDSGIIDKVQENVVHKTHTRYDWLTFLSAREYIGQHHPKIVFIGLGETDEFAHHGKYDLYLQQATAIDKMIADLWYYVQTNSFYSNKTTFIITTDHGRGNKPSTWFTHHFLVGGSSETWLALIGPDIVPAGEIKKEQQLYGKQVAATIAMLLGQTFITAKHSGKPIPLLRTGSAAGNIEFAKNK